MLRLSWENTAQIYSWIRDEPSHKFLSRRYSPTFNYEDVSNSPGKIFICGLCRLIPRIPMVFGSCSSSHMVCHRCYVLLHQTNLEADSTGGYFAKCPQCETIIDQDKVYGLQALLNLSDKPHLKRFYDESHIRCSNDPCCTQVLHLGRINEHEFFTCRYRRIDCPLKKCCFRGNVESMSKHLLQCKYLEINCSLCSTPFRATQTFHDCSLELRKQITQKLHPEQIPYYKHGEVKLPPNSSFHDPFDDSLEIVKEATFTKRSSTFLPLLWRTRGIIPLTIDLRERLRSSSDLL